MLEPTDAHVQLPEPAFLFALGLKILIVQKKKQKKDIKRNKAHLARGEQTFRYRAF